MSYTYKYPRPAVTVDAVLYNLEGEQLFILLIKRKQDPYGNHWALPGGFMDIDETPETAVERELKEETGLETSGFVQIGAFGALDRDPRHRTISIAFLSLLKGQLPEVKGADDAVEAQWFKVKELPDALAFDHEHVINSSKIKLEKQLKMSKPGSLEAFKLAEREIQLVLDQII